MATYSEDKTVNNSVAKHAHKFNKCHIMRDRKKAVKCGYIKHKVKS